MMRRFSFGSLLLALLCVQYSTVRADEVFSKTEAANRLYKQGKFVEALKLYEDALLLSPQDAKLKNNRGMALLGTGDAAGAEKSLEGALSDKDKKTLATAHYNLGNILYRKGEAMMQQGNQEAKDAFTKAQEHYIQSLDIDPAAIDAKWNLQLAHERLKQLEQQQQQQQQNKDDKNQKNDKNQQNQDQQNQQNKNNNDKNDQQNQNQNQDQNKNDQDQQNRQNDKQDQKNQDQNKQDENKNDEQQNKDQQNQQNKDSTDNKQQQQQPQEQQGAQGGADRQQMQQPSEDEMKKAEARRILELYADDADSLNKPMQKAKGKMRQPEKDW